MCMRINMCGYVLTIDRSGKHRENHAFSLFKKRHSNDTLI